MIVGEATGAPDRDVDVERPVGGGWRGRGRREGGLDAGWTARMFEGSGRGRDDRVGRGEDDTES